MPRALNFDAIIVETIDVTKGGRTYKLRDDVPMTTLVRVFALLELQQSMRGREVVKAAEAAAWLDEQQALTLEICGAIFRHSLPELTDDELRTLFTFEEQLQLVMLFFTSRSLASLTQANAPSASSPTTMETSGTETTTEPPAETAAASATGNRQQRRSTERGKGAGTTPRKR